MLFRRKSKDGARGAKSARAGGGKAAGSGKTSTAAKTGTKATAKRAGAAKRGQSTPTGKQAKTGKNSGKDASHQQTRAQAEAQIKQMMSDGSLDKVKTLLQARNPQDVADEYPEQTVDAIRTWLRERDK